jgi:hypothetical protein
MILCKPWVDVRMKLLHWSGNIILDDMQDAYDELDGINGESNSSSYPKSGRSALLDDPPDPPKSVAEIYECTGTAVLMLTVRNHRRSDVEGTFYASTGDSMKDEIRDRPATITRMASRVAFDPGLTIEESKEMSLSACLRFLERYLDMHHFELQEAMFATEGRDGLVLASTDL